MADKPKCSQIAESTGKPCKNNATPGTDLCARHAGTGGNPGKLTPKVHTRIVNALKAGNYRETAAKHAGIGVSTFYRWLETGEADAEHDKATAYRDLWEAIEKAEADAEAHAVATVRRAMQPTQLHHPRCTTHEEGGKCVEGANGCKSMPGNWQAAMTFLERKKPAQWGRKDRLELDDKRPATPRMDLTQLSDDELATFRALAAKATPDPVPA